ncbi:MAG: PAS domain S-box protein [Syntrophobacteraceae bacterium]|jgi:PAS domain S-box-containing protein
MDQSLIAEELKKANVYLENIFENSPDAIGIVDNHGRFIKWNKMASELYGYTFEQLLGKSSFDLYADRNELERMLAHLRREGSVKKWEMQMKRRDGIVPFEISISLLRDDENRTVGSVCVARDLSEIRKVLAELRSSNEELSQEIGVRKNAEEEVRRLSRQNQLILDAAGEGIVGLDVFGRVTFINPAGAETLGYAIEQLVGKDLHELVHHSRPDGSRYPVHECPMFQSLSSGNSHQERDEVFWRKDGSNYHVAYSSTPIREKNCVIVAVITFRDVTLPRRKLEHLNRYRDHLQDLVNERTAELAGANELLSSETEQRKRAEEELQDTSQKLRLFAYSIAHDLKNPANEIQRITRRLHEQCNKIPDEKRNNRILRVSEHVSTLMAKINMFVDANKTPFSIETVDFQDVLQMLKGEFSSQLGMREINWIEPETNINLKADRVFFPLVFRNLVDNSLRYGGEKLSQIKIGHEESNDFHIFLVSDDGIGLRGAEFENFFGLFQQHEASIRVDGAGLGLATASKIAERHDGNLRMQTGVGKGTTFYISISKTL